VIRSIGSNTTVSQILALLLAAALYSLPGDYAPPAPDSAQQARIERALAAAHGTDLAKREHAARDLALIGESALPAVVARLNKADSAERVLLLTAIARLAAAQPVLDQARRDPAAAVRAVASPPQREPETLSRLAARYIDLVVMARETNRKEFTGHLKGLDPELTRSEEQYERLRERLGDEKMDGAIQWEYRSLSYRFARAADAALRSGKLRPDLDDPIFVAFLGLLYDEEVAALNAVRTLVALGESAAPALDGMLDRKGHDPRTILRILAAAGQAKRAMARDASEWPELRYAQIEMAPRALPKSEAIAFLVSALRDDESRNRRLAMEGLLALGPVPADRLLARSDSFSDEEWTLALRLRWAAGEKQALREALLSTAGKLRGARRVLRSLRDDERRPLLSWMLDSESPELRWLAVDYLTDVERLLAIAKSGNDARLCRSAVRRAIELGSAAGLASVANPDRRLVRTLRENGFTDEVVALALGSDEKITRLALNELRFADRIDAKHEKALIALYERLDEPRKWDALDALVPLASQGVAAVLEQAGARSLVALGVRVDDGHTIPFEFGLKRFVENADASGLQRLARIGGAMTKLEPGFYVALLDAWAKVDATDADVYGGSSGQRIETIRHLVRAPDPTSVRALFRKVLADEIIEGNLVMPILQAAARQLTERELIALLPKLDKEIRLFHPNARGLPPEPNPPRRYFIWYSMRALSFRRIDAALKPILRILLDPQLQRERYDEQAGRRLPIDWTRQAREALRHYPQSKVGAAMQQVMAEMEASGELAELAPVHLFRLLSGWRSNADRGRRIPAFALALCDLLDRLPFEGEPGVARMLATGAQARYVEAAAAGRAAAKRKRTRGFDPADDRWSPRLIEGRAAIYEALANNKIPEVVPRLGADPYLLWIAGIYLRFVTLDAEAATIPAGESLRRSAWLDRNARNLWADLMTIAGKAELARNLLQPKVTLPLEIAQGEGWYRFYLARALAADGRATRARGELADALRINRRLVQTAKADPLVKGYDDVFVQADEDYFDWLFSD